MLPIGKLGLHIDYLNKHYLSAWLTDRQYIYKFIAFARILVFNLFWVVFLNSHLNEVFIYKLI